MSDTSAMTSRTQLMDALRDGRVYPHPVEHVEILQTHISVLFFAADRVYKVKKAVDLGFLDYTRLEDRRRFCEEEVRLNRRLAPWVYLGVVEIRRDAAGRVSIGGTGETVDYAVEMMRLPAERMFSRLLEHGEIDNAQLNEIVERIAAFHAECPTGPGVDEHATPDEVGRQIEENLHELEEATRGEDPILSPTLHAHLVRWSARELGVRRSLMEQRVEAGRVREGHGDLHAGNICMTDRGIVAYDCIEFTPRFRCRDVACEMAFLAMDLDARGFRGFGHYLLHEYALRTDDPALQDLTPLYKMHLAAVRGKVAAIRAAEAEVDERERRAARREARKYLHLSATYTLPPAVIVMCGLPATGKSHAARAIAAPFEALVIRSDVVRKRLAGVKPTERAETAAYSDRMTEATYAALLAEARDTVEAGRTAVVDATFPSARLREPFAGLARELGLPFALVRLTCSDEEIRRRMATRAGDHSEVSDADYAVYQQLERRFEPPEELPVSVRCHVRGEGPAPADETLVSDVLDVLVSQAAGNGPAEADILP